MIDLVLVLLLVAEPAAAQEASELDLFQLGEEMEEARPVVVTASRRALPIDDAAASMTVITAAEIRDYGYTTLTEALDSVVGILTNDALETDHIIVRGAGFAGQFNRRILILLDGHALNERWSGATYTESDIIDVSAIERIEIIRGPASALYGSSGFFAVIQVITRRESEGTHFGGLLQGGYPRFGRASARAAGRSGDLRWLAHAYGSYGWGRELSLPEHAASCDPLYAYTCTDGQTRGSVDHRLRAGAYATLQWRDFSLALRYGRYDRGLPGANYSTLFNDENNYLGVQRGFASLGWSRALSTDTEVAARAYYDFHRYSDVLAYADGETPPGVINFLDEGIDHTVGAELRILQTLARTSALTWRLQGGLIGSGSLTSSDSGYEGDPADLRILKERDVVVFAPFLESDLATGDWGRLTLGLRYDYNSVFDSRLSPRAAVIFHPYTDGTIKLLYNEGFRNPSPYEAFFDDGVALAQNLELGSEVIRSLEGTYTHRIVADDLQVAIGGGAYWWHVIDFIRKQGICVVSPDYRDDPNACPAADAMGNQLDDRQQQQNLPPYDAVGAEATFSARWRRGPHVYANVAVQRSRYEDGSTVMASPLILASAGVAYPIIADRLTVAVEARVVSERLGLDADAGGTTLPAAWWINANVRFRDLVPGLDLTLTGRNLTANDFEVPMTAENEYPLTRAPGIPFTILLGAELRLDSGGSGDQGAEGSEPEPGLPTLAPEPVSTP